MNDNTLTATTHMAQEIGDIPQAIAHFLDQSKTALAKAALDLQNTDPGLVMTLARGSSSHAATYLKYAIELQAGIPVGTLSPSVASIYNRPLRLSSATCLAISQSGRSSDILHMTKMAHDRGALTIAITNHIDSPLAGSATHCLALLAGEEKSVAATKTFVNSVVAGLVLLAEWQQDRELREALNSLPEAFSRAITLDWTAFSDYLTKNPRSFVLGRGPGVAIASEAALKLKETCGVQAAAFSAAEVLHGPAAIVKDGFPVLALGVEDAALPRLKETASKLAAQGANVFATQIDLPGVTSLPAITGLHPLLAPLVLIGSFYAMVETLSRQRGFDPDAPPHLCKVTKTM